MSPQPPVLAGWSGWRWSGLVYIGRNPDGLEQSLGEVYKDANGSVVAVLNHPTNKRSVMTKRVSTVQFARKTIEEAVLEHGGAADSAPVAAAGDEPGVDAPASASEQLPCLEVDDVGSVVEVTEPTAPLGTDVLALLRGYPDGVSVAELCRASSVGYNALRQQLYGLRAAGVARWNGEKRSESRWFPVDVATAPELAGLVLDVEGVPVDIAHEDFLRALEVNEHPVSQVEVLPGLLDSDPIRELRGRVEHHVRDSDRALQSCVDAVFGLERRVREMERVAHPPIDLRPLVEELVRELLGERHAPSDELAVLRERIRTIAYLLASHCTSEAEGIAKGTHLTDPRRTP